MIAVNIRLLIDDNFFQIMMFPYKHGERGSRTDTKASKETLEIIKEYEPILTNLIKSNKSKINTKFDGKFMYKIIDYLIENKWIPIIEKYGDDLVENIFVFEGEPDLSQFIYDIEYYLLDSHSSYVKEHLKYIKSFSLYNESTFVSYQDTEISLGSPSVDFGITHGELDEILYEITDEFPELEYTVDNSLQSAILDMTGGGQHFATPDQNSFVVTFYNGSSEFPMDLKVLHYIEPKIFDLIGHVSDKLGRYGLEVYFSDFGENDAYYELLITKKGNKPTLNKQKYIVDDNGEIQYKN